MASARDVEPLLLHTLMDRAARLQPDNLIVTRIQNGYHQRTYAEHQVRTYQLANALAKRGMKIGDVVGTLMWNNARHLEAYHALSCMGTVLHTLNLRLSPSELAYIILHAGDKGVIVDANLLKLLEQVDKEALAKLEFIVVCADNEGTGGWTSTLPNTVDYEDLIRDQPTTFKWPSIPEHSIHALCYTSGTTGKAKGAAYSQRSTYLHTLVSSGADQLGITGYHTVMPVVPMFHVLSWGVPFVLLMSGSRLVFNNHFMDPASLLQIMEDWKVNFSTGVPTIWQGVRAAAEQKYKGKMGELKAKMQLQYLTCGGSAPPKEMMQWYLDTMGVEFIQGWGMTETNPLGSIGRTLIKHKDMAKTPQERFEGVCKAGIPVPIMEYRLANPENLDEDVPHGQQGELLVKGPTIISEYFKQDASVAAEKFHKGYLITGDVVRVDEEGAFIICDRSKDVIKSGGEWISSIDMENQITELPEVSMSCVVAMPHPKWDERPVALVQLADPSKAEGIHDRVCKHLSTKWAKYQLPEDTIVVEAIPLTTTGKMDKKVVRGKLQGDGYVLPSLRPQAKL
eukprot:CAMPEP_0204319856 /NCGR_PEP_ID=MMETSP0469-20131031/7327_1 /ASSEMBLY_ACC=CAM_ASM_000384 /TAXON_ID=2969 /ORGANISM="Oxyrrhis marina" /LENGTH=565 /DNA_ID=CAMNT_0051301075 /DNA_START=52 /DNA_END=1749 /DNA_ORIENTATION=+